MKYSADKQEKYVILRLNEEKLDTTIAPELKSEFTTLQTEGFKHAVVNLGDVKYSDSSGLSALLVGNRLFEGGSFVLCEVQDHVQKLLSISQLDKVLDIVPTEEEAVESVMMSNLEDDLRSEEASE